MAPPPVSQAGVGVCLITPELPFFSTKGIAATTSRRGGPGGKKKKNVLINTEEEYVPRVGDIFSAIGEILFKQHDYRKAMVNLDAAVELEESNKRPYLTRAACLIRLGRYKDALQELDKTADPKGTRSLVLRTAAYWYMGEFEKAAYTAARGLRKGGYKPLFKEMFYTAIGSIDRCVGPSAGEIMVEMSKDIFQMEEEKSKSGLRRRVKSLGGRVTTRDRICEARRQSRSMYMMQLHLGRLAVDNRFLTGLQGHHGFPSANKKGMDFMSLLLDCAKDELLVKLEEMLMDMPMYVHQRVAFIPKSPRMVANNAMRDRKMREDACKKAQDWLVKILQARDRGIVLDGLNVSDRARSVIGNMSKKTLPKKSAYLTTIYHLLGIIILEGHLRTQGVPEVVSHTKTLQWLGLKRSLLKAILYRADFPFLDCKRILNEAMQSYPMARTHLERAWLLYIITIANAAYSNYDGCRNHARRCVAEARLGGSKAWTILGLIMQAHSELHLNSKLDAKTSIKEALEIGMELGNEDTIEFLVEMHEAIDQQSADADTAAEEARFHRSLVMMMPTQTMKNKMRHVLHHRMCMPPARRLAISVRRDTAPNLGDTAEDSEKSAKPALWPRKKKSA